MSTLVPLLALGAWNFAVGLYSIRSALGYREYARRAARARASGPSRTPSVTLFVPCCGDEAGLEENLEALVNQEYPNFSLRFVVEGVQDGAVPVIRRTLARHPGRGNLVLAGPAAGEARGSGVLEGFEGFGDGFEGFVDIRLGAAFTQPGEADVEIEQTDFKGSRDRTVRYGPGTSMALRVGAWGRRLKMSSKT